MFNGNDRMPFHLWIIRLLRYRQPKPKANHVNYNWPELHARTNLQVTMADKGKLFIEIIFSFLLSFAKSVYIQELCVLHVHDSKRFINVSVQKEFGLFHILGVIMFKLFF